MDAEPRTTVKQILIQSFILGRVQEIPSVGDEDQRCIGLQFLRGKERRIFASRKRPMLLFSDGTDEFDAPRNARDWNVSVILT